MDTSFLKVYYINLDKNDQRDINIKKQFSAYNINVSRIQAICGKEKYFSGEIYTEPILNENKKYDKYKYFYNINTLNKPSKGEIGCLLSHIKTLLTIKHSNINTAIIMEDDISFEMIKYWDKITNLSKIINNAPENWQLLKLHTNNHLIVSKLISLFNKGILYSKYNSYESWSTMCYIVTKEYVNNFLKKYLRNNVFEFNDEYFVADRILYNFDNIYEYTLPLFKSMNNISIIKNEININDTESNEIINKYWNKDYY